MSSEVMPFVQPTAAPASLGPWQLADQDGGWRPLPTHLPDWDYQTDLVLQRRVNIDVDGLLRESQLPATTALALIVEWKVSAAQLSGLALRSTVGASLVGPIEVTLRGSDLAGRLTLLTRVVVAHDATVSQPFVANRAGEILVEDQVGVQLQGEAGRFPIYVVDFVAHDLDSDARWHLDVSSDPGQSAAGAVRLFLNANDREIVTAAVRAANPTPLQTRLLDWMHADLTRQLIDHALTEDWLTTLPDSADDPDSLGASVSALVSNLFNGEPLDVVAKLRETDPNRFESRLQGALIRLKRGAAS